MRRFSLFFLITACLLAGNVLAGGAVDKVTGEYTRGSCNPCIPGSDLPFIGHRLISAHEASDTHPQRGFFFSINEYGTWMELDFNDTLNSCVNVFEDGKARVAGIVQEGNGAQVGRAFGFYLEDNGGPAYFSDMTRTVRFTNREDIVPVETLREYLHYWCHMNDLPGAPLPGYVVWFGTVVDGNFVVHNSPRDGD